MKKLNNREIETLATKIYEELSEPINLENQKIDSRNDKELEKLERPGRKVIEKLKIDYPGIESCYGFHHVSNHILCSYTQNFEEEPRIKRNFSKEKIEASIVLAQIDAEDLNQLIENVKSQFTNE